MSKNDLELGILKMLKSKDIENDNDIFVVTKDNNLYKVNDSLMIESDYEKWKAEKEKSGKMIIIEIRNY